MGITALWEAVVILVDVVSATDADEIGMTEVDTRVDDGDQLAFAGGEVPCRFCVDISPWRSRLPIVFEVPLVPHEGVIGHGCGGDIQDEVGMGPFNIGALSLYEWSPIAEELKSLDKKIVLNSMILKWDNVKKEFIELINF